MVRGEFICYSGYYYKATDNITILKEGKTGSGIYSHYRSMETVHTGRRLSYQLCKIIELLIRLYHLIEELEFHVMHIEPSSLKIWDML